MATTKVCIMKRIRDFSLERDVEPLHNLVCINVGVQLLMVSDKVMMAFPLYGFYFFLYFDGILIVRLVLCLLLFWYKGGLRNRYIMWR